MSAFSAHFGIYRASRAGDSLARLLFAQAVRRASVDEISHRFGAFAPQGGLRQGGNPRDLCNRRISDSNPMPCWMTSLAR